MHKAELQFDLTIHTSVTVKDINIAVDEVRRDMKTMMTVVFAYMSSADERQIAAHVDSKGGADIVKQDEGLLLEVIEHFTPNTSGKAEGPQETPESMVSALRKEIAKDLEDIIKDDSKAFDQKFDVVQAQLKELKQAVLRESDRIIAVMQTGPHERIVDRVSVFAQCRHDLNVRVRRIFTICGRIW
jgi:hypothetical protein